MPHPDGMTPEKLFFAVSMTINLGIVPLMAQLQRGMQIQVVP
jgi:hypothetical protein